MIKRPSKNDLLVFLAGVNLTLLNFILIHPVIIALQKTEVAVLFFTLAYFTGISFGYYLSDILSGRALRTGLIIVLLVQPILIVSLPLMIKLFTGFVSTGFTPGPDGLSRLSWITSSVLFVIILIFGTSPYAIFLPRVISERGESLRRIYSFEVLGSIMGLLLIPFIGIISHLGLVVIYFTIFLLLIRISGVSRLLSIISGVVLIVFFIKFDSLDRYFSKWYYELKLGLRRVESLEAIKYTPYHKIEVLKTHNGDRLLLLNGRIQFGASSHFNYSYFLAEFPARFFVKPDICVLGCGSMSSVGRTGDLARKIRIVDIDEGVFEISRKYFQKYNRLEQLNNWTFTADDAKHFMANTNEKFQLILHDIPPARTRQTALTYTREFFQYVKNNLTDDGIFSISSLIPLYSDSPYGRRIIATLTDVYDNYFILSYKNSVFFYGGGKGFETPGEEEIIKRIEHPHRQKVRILMKNEIDEIVSGYEIITINNLRDLIYD